MATSKEYIKNSYPLPAYNYRVEIGKDTIAFSEVSGLSIAYETTTYKESRTEGSDSGPVVMQMPAQPTPPTLTLKKGIIQGERLTYLYDWIKDVRLNLVEKKDIFVRLCDENGDAVISWKVTNAFPTKLDAPSFTADSNDASIESMELAAERVEIE